MNMRFIKVLLIGVCAVLITLVNESQIARSDNMGSFSGSWSGRRSAKGMSGGAGGGISFSVNRDAGSFTCSISGSGSFSGSMNNYSIRGSNSVSGSGCGGSYNPDTGALSGSVSFSESWNSTSTSPDGKHSSSHSGSEAYGGSISGSISGGGGSGSIGVSGGSISWSVSGSFGQAAEEVGLADMSDDEKVDLVQSMFPDMSREKILSMSDAQLKKYLAQKGAEEVGAEVAAETPGFSSLNKKEKEAVVDMLFGDIPPDKLLNMSDDELQKHIDKKYADAKDEFSAADEALEKRQAQLEAEAQKRVQQAVEAAEAKEDVKDAFDNPEQGRDGITKEKLIKDIVGAENDYVRDQMEKEYKKQADKAMAELTRKNKKLKKKLKKEKGYVDQFKSAMGKLIGNKDAGGKAVDMLQNYGVKKFDEYAQGFESLGETYKTLKAGKDYYDKGKAIAGEFKKIQKFNKGVFQHQKSGEISHEDANRAKGLILMGKGIGAIVKKVPVAGDAAQQVVEGTFEAAGKLALKKGVLGKTTNDLIDNPQVSLEGRKMHVSDFQKDERIIYRDDPTRPGKKIRYKWDPRSSTFIQVDKKKKEPDWYDWAKDKAKGFFGMKPADKSKKKYH